MDIPVVMLLDDEPMMLRVLERILTAPGYELVTASTIAEAQALLPQFGGRLKLAFLDLWLTDGKGTTFAEELLAKCPGISIVITTGDSLDNLEAYEVLSKPFEISDLRAVVRRMLGVPSSDGTDAG